MQNLHSIWKQLDVDYITIEKCIEKTAKIHKLTVDDVYDIINHHFNELKRDEPTKIDEFGNKQWLRGGYLHRDNDLPAIEWQGGKREWYQNGSLHRENDKPAVEFLNGHKEWHRNGYLHREDDKPAKIDKFGDKWWYKSGELHRDNDLPAI